MYSQKGQTSKELLRMADAFTTEQVYYVDELTSRAQGHLELFVYCVAEVLAVPLQKKEGVNRWLNT